MVVRAWLHRIVVRIVLANKRLQLHTTTVVPNAKLAQHRKTVVPNAKIVVSLLSLLTKNPTNPPVKIYLQMNSQTQNHQNLEFRLRHAARESVVVPLSIKMC